MYGIPSIFCFHLFLQTKITCSIISDAKSIEFFEVNPDSCVLSLKKSLLDDPDLTTVYNVSHMLEFLYEPESRF